MKIGILVLSSLITIGNFASGQTITFDGPPAQPPASSFAIGEYAEAGMIFKATGSHSYPNYVLGRTGSGISFFPDNGSAFLQSVFPLEFYFTNGSAFTLSSLQLAEYSVYFGSSTVTIEGFKSDGTTVSTNVLLDGVIDGNGPLQDFQTFYPGTNFSSLIRVVVTPQQGYSLDNVVIGLPNPDTDGDGVLNEVDECPNTEPGAVVDEHGCSLAQLVPCSGPITGGSWKNHGEYVSAISEMVKRFLAQGRVTQNEAKGIIQAASQSDCGASADQRL